VLCVTPIRSLERPESRAHECLDTGGTLHQTSEDGEFSIDIEKDFISDALLLTATAPETGSATYEEAANGNRVTFSAQDRLDALVSDWDGRSLRVTISPLTHIATSFAHGLWETRYQSKPEHFKTAATEAYELIQGHFNRIEGPYIDIRTVRPVDVRRPEEGGTDTAQVRYGLVLAATSQLAATHASEAGSSSAQVNTLTLARELALDLRSDRPNEQPRLDGRTRGDVVIANGTVRGSSGRASIWRQPWRSFSPAAGMRRA
jgi:hypothetical protein